ncbi:cyclic nucleotide-binding domain-containing protein [Caenispirillum bisanense]|uniref:Cyclic nucleotide-binding domain-containing protein n=1 Tax=Caenispirillum bisanense TaxID=414052 RepID=A0A286GEV8_9PROT|nr:cyclic nucleotide-binding domain-containing protein [Caenispirillum bisanense]SOD94063.1 Cyclic nucleotide-binding domain-containing protein [Caenispirillum bisanense]
MQHMEPKQRVIERKVFYAGQYVFREGEEGNLAYLVQEGRVEIIKRTATGDKLLGDVSRGGIFGEMALIDNQPRMASALAAEQTTLIIVTREQFEKKLRDADPFIRGLLNIFVRNIRSMAGKS